MKRQNSNSLLHWIAAVFLLLLLLPDNLSAQCTKDPGVLTISSGTTANWSGFNFLSVDVRVDSNATLNIYGTNSIYAGVTIEVMPGGRLNIDSGATLTSACSTAMWNGIILHGNYNRVQASGGSYDPGQAVMIMDSGTISWAKLGVQVDSGAVLKARVSTFYNCRESLKFTGYPNQNISRIDSCDFLCEDILPGYNGESISTFVTLQDVQNLKFFGNSFINNTPQSELEISKTRGVGIRSDNSSYSLLRGGPFQLSQSGCSYAIGRKNKFEKLFRGVFNTNLYSDRNLVISETEFKNIQSTGIFCINDYYTKIFKNYFLLDSNYLHHASIQLPVCINLMTSKGFNVDSNTFIYDFKSEYHPFRSIFLSFFNTGILEAKIYSNKIINLDSSSTDTTQVTGIASGYDLSEIPLYLANESGFNSPNVQINCNYFQNLYNDMLLIQSQVGNLQDISGPNNTDAGNIFSQCANNTTIEMRTGSIIYYGDNTDPAKFRDACVDNEVQFINANGNICEPTSCLSDSQ